MKPIRPNRKSFVKSWIISKSPRPTPALLLSRSFALFPSSPLCRFFGNARHTCVFTYENPSALTAFVLLYALCQCHRY